MASCRLYQEAADPDHKLTPHQVALQGLDEGFRCLSRQSQSENLPCHEFCQDLRRDRESCLRCVDPEAADLGGRTPACPRAKLATACTSCSNEQGCNYDDSTGEGCDACFNGSGGHSSSHRVGVIVGITVGAVVLVVGLALLLYYVRRNVNKVVAVADSKGRLTLDQAGQLDNETLELVDQKFAQEG